MTTNPHHSTISTDILRQAADWVLDIQADQKQVYTKAFEEWLYADTAHLHAFEETAKTFELAVQLPALSTVAQLHPNTRYQTALRSSVRVWLSMAASVLICTILIFVISPHKEQPTPSLTFNTRTGEVSEFLLPDSSVLFLDTDSAASAQVNGESRSVRLVKGRLFADVAHDPSRIFSVLVNDTTSFTALGTAYSVEKSEASWTLKVYEGIVGVASTLVSHNPVEAGWGLRYTRQKLQLFKLPESLTPGVPDWQKMQVRFTNETLASAVGKVNQYTLKAIRVQQPELSTVLVSGVFDLSEPYQFAESVSRLTGAEIRETKTELVLSLSEN